MSPNHKTTFALRVALYGLCLTIFLIPQVKGENMTTPDMITNTTYPMRSFRIIVGNNEEKQLITQLQKFSDANHFILKAIPSPPRADCMLIEMKRDDFKITVFNPFSANEFRISFDQNAPHAAPIEAAILDDVEQSLRSFVPGLTRKK